MRRTAMVCRLLGVVFALAYFTSVSSFAGVTGKVAGTVRDSKSGDVIVGATIRVSGTNLATLTDEDGEYFIISVPSGKYDVVVSSVGFETLTKKDVRVLVDLTTPVDFDMQQMAVNISRDLVVYAVSPQVQKDLTSSRVIYTEDRIRNMPNVTTVQAVLTRYPGVVTDRKNDMHVRGGRSGQVSYYYDGYSVQDPFVANVGLRIIPTALEELSLTSGGFLAEYGDALSGVVSAVTPEGGSAYRGRLRAYEGFTHQYDVNSGTWGSLKSNNTRSLSGQLSGPIPGVNPERNSFFSALEYVRDGGSLPHNRNISYNGTGKVTIRPNDRFKLVGNLAVYDAHGDLYTHRDVNGRSYDFNLDGLQGFKKSSHLGGLSGQYAFSDRSFLQASVNRFYTKTKQAPWPLMDLHWRNWPGYSEDSNGVYDGTIDNNNYLNNRDYTNPYHVVGFTTGNDFDPTYALRESRYHALTTAYTNQVSKRHQLKAGLEYRSYKIIWDKRQFYNENPYGEEYTSDPKIASLYAQDKVEYDDFVLNLGMRYDYRDADISYNVTPGDTIARYQAAESKSRWSPRLGMSFPIGERSVMHFNYGVYYQAPKFTQMYTNLQGDVTSGYPLLGNPDLNPEQTISYELGLDHMVNDRLRIDITAYAKDIRELVTTRESMKLFGRAVTRFDNDDYGSVKGLDLAIDRLPGNGLFSASVAYTFMRATGNGSDALDPYYTFLTSTADTLAPRKEYPLDFDQRHTMTAMVDFRVPVKWDGQVFGMKLPGDWGVNMVGYYGSGLPYTKTDSLGNRYGERNEGRLPASYAVDMRFNKDFRMSPSRTLTFFVEVDNLFDRRNVIYVYGRTGLATNDNRRPTATLALNQNELNRLDQLYDHDPQNFSAPRTVRTGLEFSF